MRTLFLQAPSFDGFDGGAGSRYQMKREIKSFWYPTWLAQPAALVENSKLIDAPPHKTRVRRHHAAGQGLRPRRACTPRRRPSLPTCGPPEAARGRKPEPQDRPDRRQGRGRAGAEPRRLATRSTSWPATSSTSPSRTSPRASDFATIDGISFRNAEGVIVAQQGSPRSSRTWTRCPSSRRSTSATS